MSSETKNLKAISDAIKKHNNDCEFALIEILMNPFEVERLDWDEILGIPISADDSIGTGRFRLVCAGDLNEKVESEKVVDAVSRDRDTVLV